MNSSRLFHFSVLGFVLGMSATSSPAWPQAQGVSIAQQPAATRPAPAEPRDVSALLDPLRIRYDMPGMVAAVLQHDQLAATGATGLRKGGENTAITVRDRMHLGSCTKSMTATLCALLVEEKKLRWDSTLGEVFADLATSMHESWRAVTLEQLLTHRSGAPANIAYDRKSAPQQQRSKLLKTVTKDAPPETPGAKFVYSNVGFALAGAMAEKVAGKPWEELMQERLFMPLGMDSAGFGAPGFEGLLSEPRGHHETGLAIEPGPGADNPPAIGPAGTVHASIGDWAKYIALHLLAGRSEPRLLKAESYARLHTPPEGGDYAMGWGVTKRDWGGRVLTHNGSNTMWFCVVWVAPEKDFAVLVATNQGGKKAEQACDQAAWALIQDHLKIETAPAKPGAR